MRNFFQRKPVRAFLVASKWYRVALLMALFLVVAAVAYLHSAGLPDSLKRPLLRALEQRGFDAQFSSARLGWGPSIVIENAAFSAQQQTSGPRLSAAWTQLDLNAAAILRARVQVDSFAMLEGRLTLPVSPTNHGTLSLTNMNLLVRFSSSNQLQLTNCSAWFRGIRININGEVSDYLSMRDWRLPPSLTTATVSVPQAGPAPSAATNPRLTALEILQRIQFIGTPVLNLHFHADGRDRNTLQAELQFMSGGVQTVWGRSGPFRFTAAGARLLNSGREPFLQAHFQARDLATPWALCRDFSASVDLSREEGTNLSVLTRLTSLDGSAGWPLVSGSNWVRVTDLHWVGVATLRSPTFRPESLQGKLGVTRADSAWGSIGTASLSFHSRRTQDPSGPNPSWGTWNSLKPFALDWQTEAADILTPKLKLNHVAFDGTWSPPELTIDKLQADMYHGHLNAGGTLDVASRAAQARLAVNFDPHQLAPLLTGPARHWISLYDWETPPQFSAGLRFVLPPWTNRMDVWPEESRDSVQLGGDFSLGRGSFRGVAVNSAQSHYTYTNRVWSVPDLRVAAGGGVLDLNYVWSDLTGDYHFRVDSKLNPAAAMPLLTPMQQRTLRETSFPENPEIQGDVWGNWRTPETVGFAATLAAGHFLVRGETVERLSARVDYTNQVLHIHDLNLAHASGAVDVPVASIDFASNVYAMTNASSRIDPEVVRRALGEIAPPFMKELHFDPPPMVQASGSFVPGEDEGTDMRFIVQGGHCHWKHLTTDSVQGDVYYHIRTVSVTNFQASLYKTGKVQGGFTIDWDDSGTRFQSDASLKDINLGALAQGWSDKPNKLEGMLDGHLALGAPFDARETNLYGSGWLRVHDGLLWDIKLFGALSPMLNAIAPGSGDSRAREASASFTITNGVLSTSDLEIHSSAFRLLYRGTVDTQSRLDARVEANLLRDEPVVGHLLSWMLKPLDKIFEYRVTGTLDKPITKPLYIPKVLMELLRPFHTLKEMLPPPATPAQSKPTPAKPPAAAPAVPQQ